MPESQRRKIAESLARRGLREQPKKCPGCSETKHRDEFGYRTNGHTRSLCKQCNAAKSRAWAKRNPDKVKAKNRQTALRRYYGITESQYDALLRQQGGRCKICGSQGGDEIGIPLVVDHCHGSMRIRGLLCSPCNSGIGHLREDPSILRAAIAYLAEEGNADSLYAVPGMPSGVPQVTGHWRSKSSRAVG